MAMKRVRPSEKLRRLGGWSGGTIGQLEALAGVNVQSDIERRALWDQFKNLFFGDSQTLMNAVADHCASIALERMKRGKLSLWPGVERRLRA
jgi:thymidine phosphorylase